MTEKNDLRGINKDKYLPILKDTSIAFLVDICQKEQPKTILEIGTYIGYSASVMLDTAQNAHIDTIEINHENATLARQNLEKYGSRATIIEGDAKDVIKILQSEGKKYDLIFLDGPKGQYIKYLPTLKALLNVGGVLFADNIFFHGYVKKEGDVGHKHRTIVTNLRAFINTITTDKAFDTQILDVGDGISISKKLCK